jgi:hypothetical protein
MRIVYTIGSTFVAISLLTTAARARAPEPELLKSMRACRDQTVAADRLACFDRTVAAFGDAADKDNLVVLDRDQVRNARRSLFGFTVPNLSVLGLGGNSGGDAPEINAVVRSASQTRDGRWRLELDDGAIWLQIDDNPPFHAPHAGSNVVVRRAALGTFFIRCDGQIGFRAKRES